MTTLRPYQLAALDAVAELRRAGARSVLVQAPTGAGKTVTLAELARREPGPVELIAHRRELLKQARAKLDAAGATDAAVTSVQTFARRASRVAPSLRIVDEAHHAVAAGYAGVFDTFAVGFSATPSRLDGRGLGRQAGGPFDALVPGPSVRELIAAGFLVRPRMFAPEHRVDLSGLRARAGEFAADDLSEVMDKPSITGDAVAEYHARAPGRSGVVFCVSVAAAHHAAEAFEAAGVPARAVWGGMREADRDAAFAALAAGAVRILTSCSLIDEGLDIPDIGVVVDLAPTQSLSRFMQRCGRGMRPASGKSDLIVLDHAGNAFRHGLPDADRVWTLDGVRKLQDSGAAPVVQCPSCYAMHSPSPACPECGHDYAAAREAKSRAELRRVVGELSELTEAELRRLWLQTAPIAELMRDARTHDDLAAIAGARGYHPAWIDRRTPFLRKAAPGLSGPDLEEMLR